MEAIASWLDRLNSDGWIPREQILGEEARSSEKRGGSLIAPQAWIALSTHASLRSACCYLRQQMGGMPLTTMKHVMRYMHRVTSDM